MAALLGCHEAAGAICFSHSSLKGSESVPERESSRMASGASRFAACPSPPYYAVIFASQRTAGDNGYGAAAQRMIEIAPGMPGYLGIETARGPDGFGITVSYWQDEASIRQWKAQADHHAVQEQGKAEWYEHYELKVARVERAYGGPQGR
jgi:heme-degrading monooxygenase HmoA